MAVRTVTDKRTIFVVVATLAATVFGAQVGAIILALQDKAIPDLVADLAKVGLGAIGALLARTSTEPDTSGPPAPPSSTVIIEREDI